MAYGLANILAAIPITPGGLGVVEFVLVSMITGFGPTAGQALSAVLAYRAVNFWLPIPFGGLAYASLEFERRPSYRPVAATSPPTPRPAPSGRRAGDLAARIRGPAAPAASAIADGAVHRRRPRRPAPDRTCRRGHRPRPGRRVARAAAGLRGPQPGAVRRARVPSGLASRRGAVGCEGLRLELILQAEAQPWGGRSGPTRVQRPSAPQHPRVGLVPQGLVEDGHHPALQLGSSMGTTTSTRRSRLRSIRSAEPSHTRSGRSVHAPEAEDAGVLQVAAHDGPHPDPVGRPGHTGPEAAPPTDHQVDRHPGLRRPVEGVDHLRVGEAVGLEDDPPVGAGPALVARWPRSAPSGWTPARPPGAGRPAAPPNP